tara:strand:+ start:23589 stop:23789 length:201 start_codon:yes stop_codon:yes gene_type:complete
MYFTEIEKFRTAINYYRITQCVINMEHNMVLVSDNYGDRYQVSLSQLSDEDRKTIDFYMSEFGEYE